MANNREATNEVLYSWNEVLRLLPFFIIFMQRAKYCTLPWERGTQATCFYLYKSTHADIWGAACQGLNWTKFEFWEHHIEVENIITEPTGTSQIFVVYGRRHDKGALMQVY